MMNTYEFFYRKGAEWVQFVNDGDYWVIRARNTRAAMVKFIRATGICEVFSWEYHRHETRGWYLDESADIKIVRTETGNGSFVILIPLQQSAVNELGVLADPTPGDPPQQEREILDGNGFAGIPPQPLFPDDDPDIAR